MTLRKTILFVLNLPPPINGVTTINKYLHNSQKIRLQFNPLFIDSGLSQANDDFGSIRFGKILHYIKTIYKCIFYFIKREIDLCYITVAPKGLAFFKDSIYIMLFIIFGKDFIIHLHGKGIRRKAIKSKFWKMYYRFVFRKAYVICLSGKLANDISNVYNGIPFIVPNGIKVNDMKSINVEKENIPIVLFLSNLYKKKGVLDFIESIKQVSQICKFKFEAWIVGNSTNEITISDLKEKVLREGISKWVKILGPKYANEKLKIYEKTDIFVFPSYNEAFPLVILEAMKAGLPIITTNVGGIPDIIQDGVNGFIIEPQNIEKIKNRILLLLNNTGKRKEMSIKNKNKFHEEFTFEKFEDNLIRVLKTVL